MAGRQVAERFLIQSQFLDFGFSFHIWPFVVFCFESLVYVFIQ